MPNFKSDIVRPAQHVTVHDLRKALMGLELWRVYFVGGEDECKILASEIMTKLEERQ